MVNSKRISLAFLLLAIGEMSHHHEMVEDPEKTKRTLVTVEQCVARVLGLKEGSFRLNL